MRNDLTEQAEPDPREVGAPSLEDVGVRTAQLAVPEMMCGLCISRIERAFGDVSGVIAARASLTERRVRISYSEDATSIPELLSVLDGIGFAAMEVREEAECNAVADRTSALLPRVGVSGFAAANVMLLSVSVWSGSASDMDEASRTLFHWISAVIALPTIAYAGQPFFSSAVHALKGWRLNMDVPISVGVFLATAMSFVQTLAGSEQVYFDAALMLLFFLLIGRLLDEHVRARARGAAQNLLGLRPAVASVINATGEVSQCSVYDLKLDDRVLVSPGERFPADGRIVQGESEIDQSVISGETVPRHVQTGDVVLAGTLNGSAAIEFVVTATGAQSVIQEISTMMQAAEQDRGRYVRLADRAARVYAPGVHLLSLLTFIGWVLAGANWGTAITYAIAVLIITCPCALALAVPVVQIAATSRLFRHGVIIKAADGLERLADIDTVIFDKTGTLTSGTLRVADMTLVPDDVLTGAASLAVQSRHPYAQAIKRAADERGLTVVRASGLREHVGKGLSAETIDGELRLGSAAWVGVDDAAAGDVWFSRPGAKPFPFQVTDYLRSDAETVVRQLQEADFDVVLLSGDRVEAVGRVASGLSINAWQGQMNPKDKIAYVTRLQERGYKVLMIGDGLNDAPALAAAHASISPATATDITQTAADTVFQGERLQPILDTLATARAARRLAVGNLWLAFGYNALFVPLAVLGMVTPLLAAIAMSTSSLLVTLNACRLTGLKLALTPPRRASSLERETSAALTAVEAT